MAAMPKSASLVMGDSVMDLILYVRVWWLGGGSRGGVRGDEAGVEEGEGPGVFGVFGGWG